MIRGTLMLSGDDSSTETQAFTLYQDENMVGEGKVRGAHRMPRSSVTPYLHERQTVCHLQESTNEQR